MNKLKRILAALTSVLTPILTSALIAVPVCKAESAFEYSALTLSYTHQWSTICAQEPQRLSADLSIEVSSHGFIYTGLQASWVHCTLQSDSQSIENDITTNNIHMGYGRHYSLSSRTDLYGRLGLLLSKTDADVISRTSTSIHSSNDQSSATGANAVIGVRRFINSAQTIELTPSLQFTRMHDDTQTSLGIAMSYYLSDKVQIQTAYDYDLDTEVRMVSLDFRIYGKSF